MDGYAICFEQMVNVITSEIMMNKYKENTNNLTQVCGCVSPRWTGCREGTNIDGTHPVRLHWDVRTEKLEIFIVGKLFHAGYFSLISLDVDSIKQACCCQFISSEMPQWWLQLCTFLFFHIPIYHNKNDLSITIVSLAFFAQQRILFKQC